MGADPAWCTLSLTLPSADSAWLESFLEGFLALARMHGMALVGGDTTRGPLSICVTAHGLVPEGTALRRSGAIGDDDVWVTGTLGDAAAALMQWQAQETIAPELRARLDRPTPRVAAGRALRGVAHACIDISDGLLADLGHLLQAGGVGAIVETAQLPQSSTFARDVEADVMQALQLSGGDDYELCFVAAATQRDEIESRLAQQETSATRIGRIVSGSGIVLRDAQGQLVAAPLRGWNHFGGERA
jgi:thiamine-monophosphate kinase